MNSTFKIMLLALFLMIYALACDTLSRSPGQTVRKSYELMQSGDVDEYAKLCSKHFLETAPDIGAAKKFIAAMQQDIQKRGGIRSIDITKEDILGDRAEVTDQLMFQNGNGFTDKTKLVKEDGEWKLDTLPETINQSLSPTPTAADRPGPTSKVPFFSGYVGDADGKRRFLEFLSTNERKIVRIDITLSQEQANDVSEYESDQELSVDLGFEEQGLRNGGELNINFSQGKNDLTYAFNSRRLQSYLKIVAVEARQGTVVGAIPVSIESVR